jgi:ABC-type uncharacterized transport system substrate-binding protein
VLVAWSSPAVAALKHRTSVIPIVIAAGGDPVLLGFVTSLSRPGGNVTGVTANSTEIYGKWIELLREAVPSAARIGVLWDSADASAPLVRQGLDAARKTSSRT